MAGQKPAPEILSLVVADGVHTDPGTGKYYILGAYTQINAKQFPTTHPSMVVYAEASNGHGDTPFKLRLIDVDEARAPVFDMDVAVKFPSPIAIIQMVFAKVQLVFPLPGDYRIQLISDGQTLRERRLFVRLVK